MISKTKHWILFASWLNVTYYEYLLECFNQSYICRRPIKWNHFCWNVKDFEREGQDIGRCNYIPHFANIRCHYLQYTCSFSGSECGCIWGISAVLAFVSFFPGTRDVAFKIMALIYRARVGMCLRVCVCMSVCVRMRLY